MPLNEESVWLLSYDIRNPRRLARLHRYLRTLATPIQYSVFLYLATAARLDKTLQTVARRYIAPEDDVRAYPLPDDPEFYLIGRQLLPQDVQLLSSRGHTAVLMASSPPRRKRAVRVSRDG